MKHHWIVLILVLLVGYFIGAKFPTHAHAVMSKVGM